MYRWTWAVEDMYLHFNSVSQLVIFSLVLFCTIQPILNSALPPSPPHQG